MRPVAAIQPDQLMNPESVADAYWYLHSQSRDAWTFELDLRPYAETLVMTQWNSCSISAAPTPISRTR